MKASVLDVLNGRFADGHRLENVHGDWQLLRSISSNLDRLFNTRSGTIQHLPDYGLPDITEIYRDIPDSVAKLQQAIRTTAEKYEPRLRRVRVHHQQTDPFDMRLIFLIAGELPDRRKVQFQTTFSSHEMVNVRPWQRV